jgi:hypothetical protein
MDRLIKASVARLPVDHFLAGEAEVRFESPGGRYD